ncbi:hypothetical protein MMC22_001799 [Lobaria immixta]|nr:hypothetical protein [Lobaria immixta]
MPLTGLYFLPTTPSENSPLPGLVNRITANYTCAPLLPRWSLEHRLFRETPNPALGPLAVDEKPKPGPRYLQMLALSHHPAQSYVAVTTTQAASQTRAGTPASSNFSAEGSGEPATLVCIPPGPPSDDFLHLVSSRMGPMWMQRPILSVSNGLGYRVGDYRIRLGEVRQGAGSGAQLKGIAVEVEWAGAEEGEWEMGEPAIRAFWEALGMKKGRGIVQVAGMEKGNGSARQWFEVLRSKG